MRHEYQYLRDSVLAILAAAAVILVIAIDHTYAGGYEYRLTTKGDGRILMVLHFTSFEDCREARRVAEHFNHYATCTNEQN